MTLCSPYGATPRPHPGRPAAAGAGRETQREILPVIGVQPPDFPYGKGGFEVSGGGGGGLGCQHRVSSVR